VLAGALVIASYTARLGVGGVNLDDRDVPGAVLRYGWRSWVCWAAVVMAARWRVGDRQLYRAARRRGVNVDDRDVPGAVLRYGWRSLAARWRW
jgi:hypothetical protein